MGSSSVLLLIAVLLCFPDTAFNYHCDFENGMCGWENDIENGVGCGWTLRKGLGVTPDSGPFTDHTYGNSNGTYLYFQSSFCNQDLNGNVRVNYLLNITTQSSICVKFWYQMYGNGPQFQFSMQKREVNVMAWFWRGSNQGRSWKLAQVAIDVDFVEPTQLTLNAIGNMSYADVAVDDIDIVDGQCEPPLNLCDFERGDLCGFNDTTATARFMWDNLLARKADKLLKNNVVDHTLATVFGHVAYTALSGQGTATLTSPLQKTSGSEQCLTFYYLIFHDELGVVVDNTATVNLSVYIRRSNHRRLTPAWVATFGNTLFWEYATVPISLKEPYQYSFVGFTSSVDAYMFLDDISVQQGPCLEKLACTFSDGSLCGWTQASQQGAPGPLLTWVAYEPYAESWNDSFKLEKIQDARGGFAFLDSKYGGRDGVVPAYQASISSQRISTTTNGCWCFSFAYRLLLKGNATAKLSIEQNSITLNQGQTLTLFSTSNSTADMWTDVLLDVKPFEDKSDFILVVIGKVADNVQIPSRIELDNFEWREQSCNSLK